MSEPQKSKNELKQVVDVFLSKASSSGEVSQKKEPTKSLNKSQLVSFVSPFREEETLIFNLLFSSFLSQYYEQTYFVTSQPLSRDIEMVESLFKNSEYDWVYRNEKKQKLINNFYWLDISEETYPEGSHEIDNQKKQMHSMAMPGSLIALDPFRNENMGIEQLIKVLDKLVLVVQPLAYELESAYKIIKSCQYVNQELEVFIIFDAVMTDDDVEKVFSRFSEIVSQYLVVSLRCIGAVSTKMEKIGISSNAISKLNWDVLFKSQVAKQKIKVGSLDQIRFLNKLESTFVKV